MLCSLFIPKSVPIHLSVNLALNNQDQVYQVAKNSKNEPILCKFSIFFT